MKKCKRLPRVLYCLIGKKKSSWALAVFNEWRLARNMKCTTDKCPEELFEERNIGKLNRWVSRSSLKIGGRIGGLTLEKASAGLQRFMRSKKPDAYKVSQMERPSI